MEWLLYGLTPLFVLGGAGYFFWRVGRRYGSNLGSARAQFLDQRQSLNEAFFRAASLSGKPRGLRWTHCQWDAQLEWMREKRTGQLIALAGVTISFEAIEGSDMEGVAAVGNLRNATAVFYFQDGHWQTAGRAVFNLNPAEAVEHFRSEYERQAPP